jgi:CRISPR-associated protein Cmr6
VTPAGPLRHVAGLTNRSANPLVTLRRVADVDDDGSLKAGQAKLLDWAARSNVGQSSKLIAQVLARREAACARLRDRDWTVRRLVASPEWRLVVGLGDKTNPHEIGLSLHGTYGWPTIPASTLKGVARRGAGADPAADRILGDAAAGGAVWFLDALPAGEPVPVRRDVLTPHQGEWYRDTVRWPGEHLNPVPAVFLVVTGAFAFDLAGPDSDDVDRAAGWLRDAADDLGVGGKTAAGYGYLKVEAS